MTPRLSVLPGLSLLDPLAHYESQGVGLVSGRRWALGRGRALHTCHTEQKKGILFDIPWLAFVCRYLKKAVLHFHLAPSLEN